jgi:hypothetical protein
MLVAVAYIFYVHVPRVDSARIAPRTIHSYFLTTRQDESAKCFPECCEDR